MLVEHERFGAKVARYLLADTCERLPVPRPFVEWAQQREAEMLFQSLLAQCQWVEPVEAFSVGLSEAFKS